MKVIEEEVYQIVLVDLDTVSYNTLLMHIDFSLVVTRCDLCQLNRKHLQVKR